jgi:hypothetical protein
LTLFLAVCIQLAAIYEHLKLTHWSGYVRAFQLYGVAFALMILPRLLIQIRLWGYFPGFFAPGIPMVASLTTLSFFFESLLLFLAGRSLRNMIKRDIGKMGD